MTDPLKTEDLMGRPKASPKTHSIKITDEAHEAARIASGYTGETFVDLISRVVKQESIKIINEYHAKWVAKEAGEAEDPDGMPATK